VLSIDGGGPGRTSGDADAVFATAGGVVGGLLDAGLCVAAGFAAGGAGLPGVEVTTGAGFVAIAPDLAVEGAAGIAVGAVLAASAAGLVGAEIV